MLTEQSNHVVNTKPGPYGYRLGCRCDGCRLAHNAKNARWSSRMSPESKAKVRKSVRETNRTIRLWVESVKMEAGCSDCGYRQHPAALDFDHVRGEKLFEISTWKWRSRQQVVDEMAKCEVVCANCHRIRTVNRRRSAQHP